MCSRECLVSRVFSGDPGGGHVAVPQIGPSATQLAIAVWQMCYMVDPSEMVVM